MNIYQKLQKARIKLQEAKLKKTGKNTYAGFEYFELGDFLPELNRIMDELNLAFVIDFQLDLATITLFDSEKPELKIQASSPYAEVNLKGCHDIQNLGAKQTYLRRYLIVNLFNITEPDVLDATVVKEKQQPAQKPSTLSQAQTNRLFALASSAGYKKEDISAHIKKKFNINSIQTLSAQQYQEMCAGYEKVAKEAKEKELKKDE